jgi:3-oxoacyl-[acyl-carrier protein] reductase
MSEKVLTGKVAVITGAARGLGRGYALRLAELGANVAIIDRNLHAADVYEFEKNSMTAATVVDECKLLGVKSMGVEIDLTDRPAVERAFSEIAVTLGSIDIVVCNAGGGIAIFNDEPGSKGAGDINTSSTASDCPQEVLLRILDINLMTCMYSCMAAAPYMKDNKSGKIVTVSSVGGLITNGGNYHPYCTAKAAIIHYTSSLAQELGPYNINVNCIAPGVIRTGRLGDRIDEIKDIPLGRSGTIEDCTNLVEFLVTEKSSYITGKTITIDGGACDQR